MKPRANFQRRVAVNDENAMFAGTIKKKVRRYERYGGVVEWVVVGWA